jgi:hypothetical protein
VEKGVVAGQLYVVLGELVLLGLGLLQADEVRPLAAQPAEQPLGGGRADAADIDGDHAHLAMI